MKVAFISSMESVALRLLGHSASKKRPADAIKTFKRWDTGYPVRICRSHRVPLAGSIGKIVSVDPADAYGAYLVRFGNGLQFRYQEDEFTALPRGEQDSPPRE
jgi:hypothetical protein